MLVSDLIASSLRLIGAIASGEGPTTTEQSDALIALNSLIDQWNTQAQMRYATGRYVFPLTAGKQTYSIGTSGTPDINTTRPQSIRSAGLLLANADPTQVVEAEIEVLDQDGWQAIQLKALTSTFPTKLYFENDYPNGIIAVWPVPTQINSVALYIDQLLTQFATAGDTVSWAPGYVKALRYGLAVEIAPEYGIDPSPLIVQQALLSIAWVKNQNVRIGKLRVDPALRSRGGRFDWTTGEIR